MDIDSQPSRKRAADVQTEELEDGEQMTLTEVHANESTLSLPQAEGESSWEHDVSEMHNQPWEDKVAGDECLGLGEFMDITTMNEQGGAHPCASWRLNTNVDWSRMTQREKDDELHKARVHMQFVACTD